MHIAFSTTFPSDEIFHRSSHKVTAFVLCKGYEEFSLKKLILFQIIFSHHQILDSISHHIISGFPSVDYAFPIESRR
jgi:hypothetical protein